ncbi:NPCBM/NEW2 domain-containing protein [Flavobacteriaceae bacterium SZ-1-7]|uniref:NPCBM/NEW2 domain-containing protein n=1 Tax=Tamlana sedimenti TaxID=3134126 RepID=UPI003125A298
MKKKIFVLATILLGFMTLAQNGNELPFQKWALTPPMGWNSWDCFGPSVVESEVKANADYMAANLKASGWEYIVVDIRWYVDNEDDGHYNAFNNSTFVYDEFGRYLPSPTRFPSSTGGMGFKPLADYVHGLGLKFGIHIMRGVPKKAVTDNLPILNGNGKTAADIYSTAFECTWLQDNWTIDASKEGAQEYYNSIMDLYASWGVDYIKVDDLSRPYHDPEIELIRNAIDQTGRPMVLSMSPGATPLNQHEHAKDHSNMWRIFDDFWDNWSQLNYAFGLCADWAPYISPGAWPDADMLPLGKFIRGERATNRYTLFTEDEQYTLMSLWTIFKSPLMFGGNLPDNNAFTNALITNEEVLTMHKTSVNNQEWFSSESGTAWIADDPSEGDKYVALFNNGGNDFVNTNDLIYRSGNITELTDGYGVDIDVDITPGTTSLFLIVDGTSDGNSYDWADWINPTIHLDDDSTILLTDLDWEYATSGWMTVKKNLNVENGPLNINGTTYTNGLGTHANSVILYQIPNNTVRFTAFAGLDFGGTNQINSTPTLEFMIATEDPTKREVDVNKTIKNSGRVSRTIQNEGVYLEADITGATKLYLVVTDAGDNFNYDHGDWINPRIIKTDNTETRLTDLSWVSATSGWDTVKINKSLDNNPLTVNGMAYEYGFGVNAYSIIEFDIPQEDYTLFKAFCGFDDEVLNAPNGVTMEFMVFTQDPSIDNALSIPVDLAALGFNGDCSIRDMWSKIDLGTFSSSDFAPVINNHGSGLYRVSGLNRSNEAVITLSGPSEVNTGENVFFDINVVTSTDTPSGYVMIYQDGTHVGTVEVDAAGNAQFTTAFSEDGTYTFTANYSGNANYLPKISSELQVTSTTLSVKTKNKPTIGILRADGKTFLTGITVGNEIEIFNIYGQKVMSLKAKSNKIPINYFQGIAIIKVKTDNDWVTLKAIL